MKIGLDIGSTTIKCVVLDGDKIVYQSYERHYSHIVSKAAEVLHRVESEVTGRHAVLAISGSAGMGLAAACKLPSSARARTPGAPCTVTGAWAGSRRSSTVG